MLLEKNNLRRILLLIQIILFFIIERILPQSLKYFSSYGSGESLVFYPIFFIPVILLIATFILQKYQGLFFFLITLVLVNDLYVGVFLTAFFALFFFGISLKRNNNSITVFWILIQGLVTFLSIYYLRLESSLSWFWLLVHVSWALKSIAWTVSVRLYEKDYSLKSFLEFFFNPVFFFFTSDLNVLTPERFFNSRAENNQISMKEFNLFLYQAVAGIVLLIIYGAFQNYYFLNLDNVGILGKPYFGAAISIAVAILFHAANSSVQVSMLNAFGYKLHVDMNRPWLAISPSDYWKRMHFYVREYIFEIITKPIMTYLIRWNAKIVSFKLVILAVIYLIFSTTQVGYQPYRQGRTLLIGFLVTGVFVAMMALPELLFTKKTHSFFEKNHWLGRVLTFTILYVGYYFIFSVRKGF